MSVFAATIEVGAYGRGIANSGRKPILRLTHDYSRAHQPLSLRKRDVWLSACRKRLR